MPKSIDIPGHGVVEFPDQMADDEIKSVIKRKFFTQSSSTPHTEAADEPTVTATNQPENPQPAIEAGVKSATQATQAVLGTITNPAAGEASKMGQEQGAALRSQQEASFGGVRPETDLGAAKPAESTPAPLYGLQAKMPDEKETERLVAAAMEHSKGAMATPFVPLGDWIIKDKGTASTAAEEGINESLRDTLNGLTTGENITLMAASMGMATTSKVAARMVSALWSAFMGKATVEEAIQLKNELSKPNPDKKTIAQLLTSTGTSAAFSVMAGAHAAGIVGDMKASASKSAVENTDRLFTEGAAKGADIMGIARAGAPETAKALADVSGRDLEPMMKAGAKPPVSGPAAATGGTIATTPPKELLETSTPTPKKQEKATQTQWGRKTGDKYDEGMPEKIIASRSTATLNREYTVKEVAEILSPTEIELSIRDMTPEEIKSHRERLVKENEMRRELGIPEEPIPEVEKSKEPPPAPVMESGAAVEPTDISKIKTLTPAIRTPKENVPGESHKKIRDALQASKDFDGLEASMDPQHQGFIDQDGNFVSREDAYKWFKEKFPDYKVLLEDKKQLSSEDLIAKAKELSEPKPTTASAPVEGADRVAALNTELLKSLSQKYGDPVAPTIPAEGHLETLSRASNLLERSADKSTSPDELTAILKEAQGLPSESRIANAVANNPHSDSATFESAIVNPRLAEMVGENWPKHIRERRAELRKQRGLDKPTAPVEGVKEPWQLTKSEFQKAIQERTGPKGQRDETFLGLEDANVGKAMDWWKEHDRLMGKRSGKEILDDPFGHKRIIENALKEGKDVPSEVLKDYPELGKKESGVSGGGEVMGQSEWNEVHGEKQRQSLGSGIRLDKTGRPVDPKRSQAIRNRKGREISERNTKAYVEYVQKELESGKPIRDEFLQGWANMAPREVSEPILKKYGYVKKPNGAWMEPQGTETDTILKPTPSTSVNIENKDRLWEVTHENGVKEQFSKESYPTESDVRKVLEQRKQRGLDLDAQESKLKTGEPGKGDTSTDTGKLGEEPPLAFGGSKASKKAAPTPPPPVATTPAALTSLQRWYTPGLDVIRGIKEGIQSLLLPSSKSAEHLTQAEILGSKLGPMNQRAESAASQLKSHSKMFDRLGVHREELAPSDNPGIRFMSDMSQGRTMTGRMKAAADLVQKLFSQRLEALEKADAPLQTIRENYFPGMWTKESRLAFNAAMEQAVKEGTIKADFDVNSATPEQRARVKEMVDQFLENGTTSDKDMLSYLTRSPMKGKESFRKQKVFGDIMDAAEFGLRPISNNPIDLVKGKLAEMDKSIMANEYFQDLKGRDQLKIISPYEEVPDGWVKVNDKYGTIYGPPTVSVEEHIDKTVYEGLLAAAGKLGIKHERSVKFPPGQGSQALGLSYQGQNLVRTKFATETSVLAHEIGHQLDHKYGLWQEITGGEKGNERKSQIQKDLRAIADLTGGRTGKTRTKLEKIAQMMEAYVHAPEKMKEVAPTVFKKFDDFIRSKTELKGIADIKPGIELMKLTGEKYVGLPILGYRIVPEAAGEIINNYLSSSLYNNKYFGSVYKGWMGTANALNQSQLGLGSAFHAGFTTGEAQVSAGANVIKDLYGVLRGNRSASDLLTSTAKATVSSVRTAFVGDKVLNAWRNPDGVMDPKVAQIVRATELAGGGYKLETGMATEQSAKLYRDWYSGHRIRAALRSPIAATELMAKPIMDYLVPRQKAGVFSELAGRIIEQNPGKSLEELAPQFRQAWNRVDARLGQVRYNRLFSNNTAKNVVQGLVRAPGWTGGTIAELGGAFTDAGAFMSDWVKTGKLPENIPDRTAYAISLLTTAGLANAALTYAFTGTAPTGLDYFAFRTGSKDEDGNDERFMLPTYMKDVLAYSTHPLQTIANKSHPLISMLNEVFVKNQNYYGVEIRNPDSGVAGQAGQTGKYVVKSFEPFWTRGARKASESGKGMSRIAGPYIGVMPAPPSIVRTPAETLAGESLRAQMPRGARTQEQFDRSQAKREATKDSRPPYLEHAIRYLHPLSAVRVLEKANAKERERIGDMVTRKIANSTSLTPEMRDLLNARVEKAMKTSANSAPVSAPTQDWNSLYR